MATAFLVVVTRHIEPTGGDRPLDALGYALLVAAGTSLALCRRRPAVTLGVLAGVLPAYVARSYPGGPVFVTGWIALFALSVRTSRRSALVGAAALVAALGGSAAATGGAPLLHLVFVGWSAFAVFLGDAVRNRRKYLAELEARARSLELTREEEARRWVAEERLRIARDLHDGVAHAMATINVQAGAAVHVMDKRPEAARDALAAIRRASGDVLDELTALLELLREDGQAAERAPTPGLDDVEALVASMKDAELPVSLQRSERSEGRWVRRPTALCRSR